MLRVRFNGTARDDYLLLINRSSLLWRSGLGHVDLDVWWKRMTCKKGDWELVLFACLPG